MVFQCFLILPLGDVDCWTSVKVEACTFLNHVLWNINRDKQTFYGKMMPFFSVFHFYDLRYMGTKYKFFIIKKNLVGSKATNLKQVNNFSHISCLDWELNPGTF